ncbi:MAG: membrane protein insertion efficiency factor YidD [Verrucomicrobiales bacterium]
MRWLFISLVHAYRWTLRPFLHALGGPGCGCRFEPSCSEYALRALKKYGAIQGLRLTFGRLVRCQPWGGLGYDPVPEVLPPLPLSSEWRRRRVSLRRASGCSQQLHDSLELSKDHDVPAP